METCDTWSKLKQYYYDYYVVGGIQRVQVTMMQCSLFRYILEIYRPDQE